MHFDVTIGWTMRDGDYRPFSDGYRPGARQHTETITVEWTNAPTDASDEQVRAMAAALGREVDPVAARAKRITEALAEHAYEATNHPFASGVPGLTGQIAGLIAATGYEGREAGHYSLSVGDTVTVGEVTLACAPTGWERVHHTDTTTGKAL